MITNIKNIKRGSKIYSISNDFTINTYVILKKEIVDSEYSRITFGCRREGDIMLYFIEERYWDPNKKFSIYNDERVMFDTLDYMSDNEGSLCCEYFDNANDVIDELKKRLTKTN
jgi:hypothetical protein